MEFNNKYLTYDEYLTLGGTLEEMPFNLLEYQARKTIDTYTHGRLVSLDEQLEETKVCMFQLINEIYTFGNKDISSESLDGYTISYNSRTESEEKDKQRQIIETYLSECKIDGVPYLYLG